MMKRVFLIAVLATMGCKETNDGSYGVTTSPGPGSAAASVTLNLQTATIAVGGTVQLQATPKTLTGSATGVKSMTWATDAPYTAMVDGNGLVKGMGAGTAHITVTADGVQSAATITVTASR